MDVIEAWNDMDRVSFWYEYHWWQDKLGISRRQAG